MYKSLLSRALQTSFALIAIQCNHDQHFKHQSPSILESQKLSKFCLQLPRIQATTFTESHEVQSTKWNELIPTTEKYDNLVGGEITIISNEKVVLQQTFGKKSLTENEPIGSNEAWHMGSLTKSMTVTLCEFLDVDLSSKLESFQKYIGFDIHPDFRKTTLRDLANHVSGIDDESHVDLIQKLVVGGNLPGEIVCEQRRNLMKSVLEKPRDIKNSTWKYSNIGYMILGGLLEAMFDESWETLIQKHFKKNLDVDLQFRKNLFEHKSYYNPTWAAVSKDALLAKSYLEAYLQLDFSSNTALKVAWGDLPRIYGPAGLVRMTHANAQKYYTWHLQRMRNNPSIYKDQAAVISNGDLYSKGWGITRVDGKEEFFAHSGSNLANLSNICIVPSKRTLMLQNYNSFCTKVCEDNVNRFTDRIRSIV